jgi:hypothetical protein
MNVLLETNTNEMFLWLHCIMLVFKKQGRGQLGWQVPPKSHKNVFHADLRQVLLAEPFAPSSPDQTVNYAIWTPSFAALISNT